ncbi:hypothetical protein [Arthrobacter mobilis]|uniref:Uncharacterized protein n=1 Tax=Arthrobacter mobilis TaxID=2724944 RepID=A0A7X6K4X9_9MICC|nr:hypothetical protein [Arthrobacter mobilis]NKX53210.1 hypothetical protein [Arthrobacter mobilis]
MRSLGNNSLPPAATSAPRGWPFKAGNIGMAVMVLVFLVAVVFAANQNDVIGWIVAIISLGWLVLAAFVVFGVRGATRKAREKFATIQADLAGQASRHGSGPHGGTELVEEEVTRINAVRDQKLDHSFKIVQVQARVIRDYLGKDSGMVERALETIEITAHNGRGMIKKDDGGEPVSGTVVN